MMDPWIRTLSTNSTSTATSLVEAGVKATFTTIYRREVSRWKDDLAAIVALGPHHRAVLISSTIR